jgi:hypothetical protein
MPCYYYAFGEQHVTAPGRALLAVNATGDIKGDASSYWTQLPITGEA